MSLKVDELLDQRRCDLLPQMCRQAGFFEPTIGRSLNPEALDVGELKQGFLSWCARIREEPSLLLLGKILCQSSIQEKKPLSRGFVPVLWTRRGLLLLREARSAGILAHWWGNVAISLPCLPTAERTDKTRMAFFEWQAGRRTTKCHAGPMCRRCSYTS